MKTRQPLARAVVSSSSHARLPPELLDEVAAELNVASVEPLSSDESLVAYSVKANFRSLGARFGPRTQTVAAAIAAADHDVLAPAISGGGTATVDVDGEPVELGPDDVVVSERPHEGWSVVNESGETVALDLDITPSLRAAGLAREVARLVQETRKSAGLEVTDRIELWAVAEDETGRCDPRACRPDRRRSAGHDGASHASRRRRGALGADGRGPRGSHLAAARHERRRGGVRR
ncbi:MAG: DUF5915 domain-containing protein [Ilumatobacteraceae bacterium]